MFNVVQDIDVPCLAHMEMRMASLTFTNVNFFFFQQTHTFFSNLPLFLQIIRRSCSIPTARVHQSPQISQEQVQSRQSPCHHQLHVNKIIMLCLTFCSTSSKSKLHAGCAAVKIEGCAIFYSKYYQPVPSGMSPPTQLNNLIIKYNFLTHT